MHIDDDHKFHGAALLQIIEHPQFKAVNSFFYEGQQARSAYVINADHAVSDAEKLARMKARLQQKAATATTGDDLLDFISKKQAQQRLAGQGRSTIGVYLKYAKEPKGRFKEYHFQFYRDNLEDMKCLAANTGKTFAVLVCVHAREICTLPYRTLIDLVIRRARNAGIEEEPYTILVTAPKDKRLRVYINRVGGGRLSKPIIIARNSFPDALFESNL